jgi:hypothetical protein
MAMGVLVKRFLTTMCAAACAAGLAAPAGAGTDDIYGDGFEEPGSGGVPACTPEPPQYPPAGYTQGYSPTLEQLWLETTGQEIGGALAKVKLEGGYFSAMSFTRDMFNPDSTVVSFFADTSNTGIGLQGADHRYITISECPGDLRSPDDASADPLRHSACRTLIRGEGPFLYLNWGEAMNNPNVCDLDPTKTYYFNVLFDDPIDGYNAATPCSSNGGLNQCGFRMAAQ